MVDFALSPAQTWGLILLALSWTAASLFLGVKLGKFLDG